MTHVRFAALVICGVSIACTAPDRQDRDDTVITHEETADEASGESDTEATAEQSMEEDPDADHSDRLEQALDGATQEAPDNTARPDVSSARSDAGGLLDAGANAWVEPDAVPPDAALLDATAADGAFLSVGTDHCLPVVAVGRCGREAPYAYACDLEISLLAPALNCLPPELPVADDGTWCCPVHYCARVQPSTNCAADIFEYVCPTTLQIPSECTAHGAPDGSARSLCCPDIPRASRPITWS